MILLYLIIFLSFVLFVFLLSNCIWQVLHLEKLAHVLVVWWGSCFPQVAFAYLRHAWSTGQKRQACLHLESFLPTGRTAFASSRPSCVLGGKNWRECFNNIHLSPPCDHLCFLKNMCILPLQVSPPSKHAIWSQLIFWSFGGKSIVHYSPFYLSWRRLLARIIHSKTCHCGIVYHFRICHCGGFFGE